MNWQEHLRSFIFPIFNPLSPYPFTPYPPYSLSLMIPTPIPYPFPSLILYPRILHRFRPRAINRLPKRVCAPNPNPNSRLRTPLNFQLSTFRTSQPYLYDRSFPLLPFPHPLSPRFLPAVLPRYHREYD